MDATDPSAPSLESAAVARVAPQVSNDSIASSIDPPQATHQGWPVVTGPSMVTAPLPISTLPPRGLQFAHGHGHGNKAWGGNGGGTGSQHRRYSGPSSPVSPCGNPVGFQEVLRQTGKFVELTRSTNGSKFIRAAVQEGSDPNNLALIWAELFPSLTVLLLEDNGCYVIKSCMERLPQEDMNRAVAAIAADPQLLTSMCTHSLHTRRVVQYLLDTLSDSTFIIDLLARHISEIAMTQHGCIVMQRAMDVARGPSRDALFKGIYQNLVRFSMDPFANYVVQHLLQVGDQAQNSLEFSGQFIPNCVELSCNKYASNVMEKALYRLDEATQHNLLVAIYSSGENALKRMLQGFGNYLIQSSIALAPYKDVEFMAGKLRAVLPGTQFASKIEGCLELRLGKGVGIRSSATKSSPLSDSQQRPGRQIAHRVNSAPSPPEHSECSRQAACNQVAPQLSQVLRRQWVPRCTDYDCEPFLPGSRTVTVELRVLPTKIEKEDTTEDTRGNGSDHAPQAGGPVQPEPVLGNGSAGRTLYWYLSIPREEAAAILSLPAVQASLTSSDKTAPNLQLKAELHVTLAYFGHQPYLLHSEQQALLPFEGAEFPFSVTAIVVYPSLVVARVEASPEGDEGRTAGLFRICRFYFGDFCPPIFHITVALRKGVEPKQAGIWLHQLTQALPTAEEPRCYQVLAPPIKIRSRLSRVKKFKRGRED
jgi:hypothetical protein